MRDRTIEPIVAEEGRRMRHILKAVVLGQDPDDLDADDIAMLGLHRDGLLGSLGEESRRLLEAVVDELACLGIPPGEAPERLEESALATSAAFVEVADEYVALLRSALDETEGLGRVAGFADTDAELPFGVVATPLHATAAAELLLCSALVAVLAPSADDRGGWIANDRRQTLRSMLVARARITTMPPPMVDSAAAQAEPQARSVRE